MDALGILDSCEQLLREVQVLSGADESVQSSLTSTDVVS